MHGSRRKADIATARERAARQAMQLFNRWMIGWLEQPEAERKKLGSASVSEKSEVADANEAAREQVQQEAAQRTHRPAGSSNRVHCCRERNRASER